MKVVIQVVFVFGLDVSIEKLIECIDSLVVDQKLFVEEQKCVLEMEFYVVEFFIINEVIMCDFEVVKKVLSEFLVEIKGSIVELIMDQFVVVKMKMYDLENWSKKNSCFVEEFEEQL